MPVGKVSSSILLLFPCKGKHVLGAGFTGMLKKVAQRSITVNTVAVAGIAVLMVAGLRTTEALLLRKNL